ncbi:MAG: HAD-IA family hydrolase [Methyloprofundus sp.]|nr:HAD-IA family hydrolase [Methyloprofundus sp.]
MNLNSYDVIILDCDGVVFDSNLLKVEAFKKALKHYPPSIVEEFSQYFQQNFGTSRYYLAKIFIQNFLKKDFTEKLYQQILNDYGENCILLYKETEFTNNFKSFLQYYKNKKLYIASGGDENELNEVFKMQNIHHYFDKIMGSPRKKTELINEVLMKNTGKKTIMIGDAKSDFLASQDNNIDFIYMRQYSLVKDTMEKLSQEYNFNIINNLGDLSE